MRFSFFTVKYFFFCFGVEDDGFISFIYLVIVKTHVSSLV